MEKLTIKVQVPSELYRLYSCLRIARESGGSMLKRRDCHLFALENDVMNEMTVSRLRLRKIMICITLNFLFVCMQAAVEQLVGRVGTTISNLDLVDDTLSQRERLVDR